MTFFNDLSRFGANEALVDAESGVTLTYAELESRVQQRSIQLAAPKRLVFLEARNTIGSVVDYLACLRAGHVVYLLESVHDPKTRALIDTYRPHIIIHADEGDQRTHSDEVLFHRDLALLLSTSGSTGSPKFVKLSAKNIDSNANSIAKYLNIQPGDRAYAHLKPYYSYGLSVLNSHLAVGASLILTSRGVDEPEFLDQIRLYRATSFAGVPYTFEALRKHGFELKDFPWLRTMTQAGGRLEAHLVEDLARSCAEYGKSFFVMYGQTEAAPRISYLPPELAERFPNSIGLAIPGGTLFIVDENRQPISQADMAGELAYKGPNVMMGYASSLPELASDETPECLYTGDIAYRNDQGLFFIVGRTSRFVKIYGLRINLDQIQSSLKANYPDLIVAGDDQRIVVAYSGERNKDTDLRIRAYLVKQYHLPESIFVVLSYTSLPLLPNGKYDLKRVLADSYHPTPKSWLTRVASKIVEVLELNERSWGSISDMYADILGLQDLKSEDTFDSIGADSLSYVSLSIEMENAFKDKLPTNWRKLPLAELDALYLARIQ